MNASSMKIEIALTFDCEMNDHDIMRYAREYLKHHFRDNVQFEINHEYDHETFENTHEYFVRVECVQS